MALSLHMYYRHNFLKYLQRGKTTDGRPVLGVWFRPVMLVRSRYVPSVKVLGVWFCPVMLVRNRYVPSVKGVRVIPHEVGLLCLVTVRWAWWRVTIVGLAVLGHRWSMVVGF